MTGASPGRAVVLSHVAAVLVAVVIFTLVYEPFHAGAVVFLALAPITLVFTNPHITCSLTQALFSGFAFGLLASMAIVGPWMYSAAVDYFDRSAAWSFGFTLMVNAAYVGAFYAPAFAALRLLAASPPMVRVLGAASIWIVVEALRSAAPFGNSWALLGQGLADVPLLRDAAAYGGVDLLGFAAALCGSATGVALQPDVGTRDGLRCTMLAIAGPFLLALLAATIRLGDQSVIQLPPLRVAVVQAEIPSRDVWDPAQRMNHWNAYLSATETLAPGSVDLVVWPESAVPFLLDADSASRSRLIELSTTLDSALMIGAPRSESTGEGRAALYNSVYFFSPGLPEPRTYDKRRLLPFVESMPLRVGDAEAAADYSAGDSAAWFQVRSWRVSPLLCFESVYPQYAREAVAGGAHLLVNLSNDAWFAGGAGPEQHYAMSSLRTVELRRPMVRAANGGISGAIGADGQTIGFPIRRQKAVRVYEIPPPPDEITVATRYPHLVRWSCFVMAGLALLLSLRRLGSRT